VCEQDTVCDGEERAFPQTLKACNIKTSPVLDLRRRECQSTSYRRNKIMSIATASRSSNTLRQPCLTNSDPCISSVDKRMTTSGRATSVMAASGVSTWTNGRSVLSLPRESREPLKTWSYGIHHAKAVPLTSSSKHERLWAWDLDGGVITHTQRPSSQHKITQSRSEISQPHMLFIAGE
jgi:hypothetical protein